jgi:hypothetical protein
MFQRIVLQTSSGSAISTLYSDMIVNKLQQRADSTKLNAVTNAAGASTVAFNVGTGANALKYFYCPLLFDALDHPSTWLDLLSLEQLSFMMFPRSAADYSGGAGVLSLQSCDLVLYYALPSPERHNMMLEAKHPGGASFNYIGFNQFAESRVTLNNTAYSIQMYCSSPIYRTLIAVRTAITGADFGNLAGFAGLTSVKVSDSGNTLYYSVTEELGIENGLGEVGAGLATSYIIINWGLVNELDPDQKRSITAVSLFQMANPVIELVFAAAANRFIDVYHQTLNAVSVSSSPNNRNRQITVLSDR